MAKKYLILDYETFSECDIRASGAYEYAKHASTEILCVGYVYGTRDELADEDVKLLAMPDWETTALDTDFLHAMQNPETVLVAHNAFFEQCISKFVLPRHKNLLRSGKLGELRPSRWICTASLSRALGIPGNLEGAGMAMGLTHQKDTEGHRLMLKLCKPRKASKNNPSTRHDDPAELQRLYEYCKKDVEAERELFLKLPPLHPKERKIWVLNQEMNLRGFTVDRKLVKGALHCIARTTAKLDKRFVELTGLDSARQCDKTKALLKTLGLVLPDLKAPTVEDAIRSKKTPEVCRDILEIRQAVTKSSTAKYAAFDARSRHDGRARDNTIYFGAHTGRDSGTGLQPQNLFKSTIAHADVVTGIDLIKERDLTAIEALFEKPMELYASALRSCIVAPKGSVLDVGDFATIEVRVLFWLAGHAEGLKMIADGVDIYQRMACKIYEIKAKDLARRYAEGEILAKLQRQLGKVTVLGSGFGIGLGGEKFVMAAKVLAGLDISQSLAQKCVAVYREENRPVVKFWDTIERAAVKALQNPGKCYKHGLLKWRKEGNWLTCELPMGRKFFYYSPRYMQVQSLYGPKMALTYRGVESVSRKFIRMSTWGGKLTENIVQAVARDLLMESLLRLDSLGASPVLAVHDEIVCERILSDISYNGNGGEMAEIMEASPSWAEGLPIKVEGWSEERYRK